MRLWFQCWIALGALLLAGCTAYQLGRPTSALPASVHIAPVTNRSEAPQVRALLTDALREEFLRAGQWNLQSAEQARAGIEVTLIDFQRDRAATSSQDTGRALSLENRLVAEVRIRDLTTGEDLLPSFTVEASGVAFSEPGLPDSEYQELPALAAQLADRIQDRLATGSW